MKDDDRHEHYLRYAHSHPQDFRIETLRIWPSTPPSPVKVIHTPTGIYATCNHFESERRNTEMAFAKLINELMKKEVSI